MGEENGVIEIFLTDGSSKGFYVSSVQTTNAIKYLVSKRLGLDQTEWPNFGLFVLVNNKKIQPLTDEHPLNLHLMWGEESGKKFKFLFKKSLTSKEKAIESKSVGTWIGAGSRIPIKKTVTKSIPNPSGSRMPRVHFDDVQPKSVSPPISPGLNSSVPMAMMSPVPGLPLLAPTLTSASAPAATVIPTPMTPPQGLDLTQSEPDLENFQPQNTQISMVDYSTPQQGLQPIKVRSIKCSHTLINWVNMKILPRNVQITNLSSDFQDGVLFWVLLETLLERKLKGWHPTPNSLLHKLDNLSMFLHTLGNCGIKLIGVNAEDLYSTNNEDLVTVILVALIKQYQEQRTRTSSVASVLLKQENRTFTKFHLKEVDNANTNLLPKDNIANTNQLPKDNLANANLPPKDNLANANLLPKDNILKSESSPAINTETAMYNQRTKSVPLSSTYPSTTETPRTITIHFVFDDTKKRLILNPENKSKMLREILTRLCILRNWNIDDFVVRNLKKEEVDIDIMIGDLSTDEITLEPKTKTEKNTDPVISSSPPVSSDLELGDSPSQDSTEIPENSTFPTIPDTSTEVYPSTQESLNMNLPTTTLADIILQHLTEDIVRPSQKLSGPKTWPIHDNPSAKPRRPPNPLLTGLHKSLPTNLSEDPVPPLDTQTPKDPVPPLDTQTPIQEVSPCLSRVVTPVDLTTVEFPQDQIEFRSNSMNRINFLPWTSPRVTEEPRNTFLANSRNQPFFLQPSLQKRRTEGTGGAEKGEGREQRMDGTKETTSVDLGSELDDLGLDSPQVMEIDLTVSVPGASNYEKKNQIDLGDINQLLDMLIAELNE